MPTEFNSRARHVAAIFETLPAFEATLDRLVASGVDASAISVLGDHGALKDHFGDAIPTVEAMADRRDTPREGLDVQTGLAKVIHAIGEGLATVGMVGMTGIAYAVGGPVGLAAAVSDETEATVENALDRYVGEHYREQFKRSVADGGMVMWVAVTNPDEE
ncbi:MAG: hypothetical protein AAF942_16160, partial [Pseudomonadota bacterium]